MVKMVEEFVMNAQAPFEHLFRNHQYCGELGGPKKASKINMIYVSP